MFHKSCALTHDQKGWWSRSSSGHGCRWCYADLTRSRPGDISQTAHPHTAWWPWSWIQLFKVWLLFTWLFIQSTSQLASSSISQPISQSTNLLLKGLAYKRSSIALPEWLPFNQLANRTKNVNYPWAKLLVLYSMGVFRGVFQVQTPEMNPFLSQNA